MPAHGTISRPSVVLTPSSQANYNIRTAAGSPAVASDVFVTVGNGIVISGASTTGTGWPANSSIKIGRAHV